MFKPDKVYILIFFLLYTKILTAYKAEYFFLYELKLWVLLCGSTALIIASTGLQEGMNSCFTQSIMFGVVGL